LITELFCGRGSALLAWEELGFRNIEGLDISSALLGDYEGTARVYCGDARSLPFKGRSRDIISVQGGLHHLSLMDDLDAVLEEAHRVLVPGGRLLVVEPWLTPSLRFVHGLCRLSLLRRIWSKLDALARMIELEGETYEAWLSKPDAILDAIVRIAEPVVLRIRWGKLSLVAIRRDSILAVP
jgi:ubiquinone/menaquinone biosynthesis C-methylase UbiE